MLSQAHDKQKDRELLSANQPYFKNHVNIFHNQHSHISLDNLNH